MLTSVSVAPSLGLPSNTFTSNLGKIQNKGVEVNLNAVLIRDQGKDFEWSVMLQAAHNKNKIMEISTALKTRKIIRIKRLRQLCMKKVNP